MSTSFVRRIAAALVLSSGGVALSGPVGALTGTSPWFDQALTQATSSQFTSMTSVSCPTSSFCAAGGSYTVTGGRNAFVSTFNGSNWTSHIVGASLGATTIVVNSVSCVSAAFCIAAGNFVSPGGSTLGFVTSWNGVSWSDQALPPLATAPTAETLSTVSCVTTTFCAVGGGYLAEGATTTLPFVSVFDGTTWRGQTFDANVASSNSVAAGAIDSVSCVSATFCEAGGDYGDAVNYGAGPTTEPLVASWNGVRWSAQQLASTVNTGHNGNVTAVSCVSTTFCVAAGTDAVQQASTHSAFLSEFNGLTWSSQGFADLVPRPLLATVTSVSLPAVSCTSAQFCVATGSYVYQPHDLPLSVAFATTWNGQSWAVQSLETSLPPTGGAVASTVSCVNSTFCVVGGNDSPVGQAVGSVPPPSFAFVSVWNGGSWLDQPTATSFAGASSASVQAVSCTEPGTCQAVGEYVDSGGNQQDFASTNVVLRQSPLVVLAPTRAIVGREVYLTTSGGSGTIAPTFAVTGRQCLLAGPLLTATAVTTCVVTARNEANGMFDAATAAPVTVTFTLARQPLLLLRLPRFGTLSRPVVAVVTGGGGVGRVRLSASGNWCSVRGLTVVATQPTLCTVRATKASSGSYGSAESAPVVVSFR